MAPTHALVKQACFIYHTADAASQGGGRSSARETIGRVAAGAIAKKILAQVAGVEILAFVSSVRDVSTDAVDLDTFTMDDVEANIVRCPDAAVADKMIAAIDEARPSAASRALYAR